MFVSTYSEFPMKNRLQYLRLLVEDRIHLLQNLAATNELTAASAMFTEAEEISRNASEKVAMAELSLATTALNDLDELIAKA